MTSTQYIIGWAAYLAGATGCLTALWLISKKWPVRLRRLICMNAAVLLYLPWKTLPDGSYLSPALLTTIYDGLGLGIAALPRAGTAVIIALAVTTLAALYIPMPIRSGGHRSTEQPPHGHSQRPLRKEPTC